MSNDTSPESSVIGRVLTKHRGERHLIALDRLTAAAIAAAAVHQEAGRQLSIDSEIGSLSDIRQPEEAALMNYLGIQVHNLHDDLTDREYDGVILINHWEQSELLRLLKHLPQPDLPLLLGFGQHPDKTQATLPEALILQEGTSSATLYAGVLEHDLLHAEATRPYLQHLATGLILGIMKSTHDLARANRADFRAIASLMGYFDPGAARSIRSPTLSAETLEVLRRALSTRAALHGFSAAGVGYLSVRDRPAISYSAQFLLKETAIHTTLVFGIVRDRHARQALYGVLMTQRENLNLQGFLELAFHEWLEDLEIEVENEKTAAFKLVLGGSSRNLPSENQLVQWSYYEIGVLEKFVDAILWSEQKTRPSMDTEVPDSGQ